MYTFNKKQYETFAWLKDQALNTDDQTLFYWIITYSPERIMDVVNFAHYRQLSGQKIFNLGGSIHKFLITNLPVPNLTSEKNRDYAKKFAIRAQWIELKIYEKHVKDILTGEEVSLCISTDPFTYALENIYARNQLHKNKGSLGD